MTILALITAGFTVWAWSATRSIGTAEPRHLAVFVGFSAATASATAICIVSFLADARPHSMDAAVQGAIFVGSIIAVTGAAVAFFAGFFARGRRRVALLSSGVAVAFIYLGLLVSHFGD